MALKFTSLQEFYAHGFDAVIDVRSPAEFAEDHVPGAISLPVLDNNERAEVGTIYVQDSPFKARKLGAALVFRNAANHIEQHLSHHEGGWKPLVYCWRGGQRSGSFTWMLQQIGWRAEVVEGGYQSYRRLVHKAMYETRLPHRLVALDGYTGSAKTEVLKRAGALGVQVLDLEGLANHRGSLLGDMPTPQPSQKGFESAVAGALMQLDPARPVLVEAESNKIGQRIIPPAVWDAMKPAPRIELQVPAEARCRYLVEAYDDILSDTAKLREKLGPLRAHRSGAVVDGWFEKIAAGDKAGLTALLMAEHYDPAYRKSRAAIGAEVVATVEASALDEAGLDEAAARLAAVMAEL
ncbi:tRNA 2-selenouridine(34) synthase MnmH [Leisingera sp. ANG-Vp]|uniref:tRNA 2-selenouridine(34) synthase MnmH n=1 Tax=Leisingera sp. ANG-Vp TaxID=1577896 RepID=UPI00057E7EAF|nr:tRNA 2-selenouridine(34) synthase MnmH [Leisingera sp. ANG-Vp]KIC17683.1 tRNA 2-selenouridine synthase [Leisingera sp. ANG-Vp]